MSQCVKIKFMSWNCRGLQKMKNIKQVMNKLKDSGSTMIFVQETPTVKEDHVRMCRRWQGAVYAASFSSHTTAVLSLIHTSVSLK